jgi:hypothetical protein
MHIAFKCTYNNGGEGIYVGFQGACSEDIIKWNIEQGRVWCSQDDCECKKYYIRGFKENKPIDPCYESVLFKKWEYGAGYYHTGIRKGTPIHISNVEEGDIVILTTRFPNDAEIDRKIIGLFKIAKIENKPETILIADKKYRIKLTTDIAKELYFWDYYSTREGNVSWRTGLFRYLNDIQVGQVLRDIMTVAKDDTTKILAKELFSEIQSKIVGHIPQLSGDRLKKGKIHSVRRILVNRKYGPKGESEAHKKLKEWIAIHPEYLGLKNVKKVEIEEHVFPSRDLPDIVFIYDNKYAVVEIETTDPLLGAYQSLKYKVLLCAERSLSIDSELVKSFLVAYIIPDQVKDFCQKYGIETKVKKDE